MGVKSHEVHSVFFPPGSNGPLGDDRASKHDFDNLMLTILGLMGKNNIHIMDFFFKLNVIMATV